MTIGNLQVTAVTIRGLAENGVHDANAFLGCYIDASDKHRTQTQQGPEPQWNQTLTLPIPENKTTLYLEIVNENPSNPGVIGRGSYDFSPVVYQNERLDEIWVPIYSSNNTSTVGHLLIRLDKHQQHSQYQPPQQPQRQHSQYQPPQQPQQYQADAPPAYSGSFSNNEYPQEKQHPPPFDRQSSYASLGPDQPLPENYGTGNPPPFTPPATSSNDPPAYPPAYPPSSSSYAPPPTGTYPMPGTPQSEQTPTQQPGQKEEGKPDWMKIGLGAAAALGVGAFAVHEYKEHQEKHHNKH